MTEHIWAAASETEQRPILFLQNISETSIHKQWYLEHAKKNLSVREDHNLNYCDGIVLKILKDHKCQ